MSKVVSYKDLDIWKKGIELVKNIYQITECFPKSEMYGLTSQLRRCAVSIPSNVAEGFRRQYSKEFKQFLSVAIGSAAELETQIIIAKELNYIDTQTEAKVLETVDHLSRMIFNLNKKL